MITLEQFLKQAYLNIVFKNASLGSKSYKEKQENNYHRSYVEGIFGEGRWNNDKIGAKKGFLVLEMSYS